MVMSLSFPKPIAAKIKESLVLHELLWEPMACPDLEEKLDMPHATMHDLLDRLEAQGVITKQPTYSPYVRGRPKTVWKVV